MSERKREEFEDDGRTIADMSGVTRRNLFGFLYLFIEITMLSVFCVDKVDKTQPKLQRSLQTRDKNI